jgi:hypothetical protein
LICDWIRNKKFILFQSKIKNRKSKILGVRHDSDADLA